MDYRVYHWINLFVYQHAWLGRGLSVLETWAVPVIAISTFALWLGTVLNPEQIGLMFGVILTPMIFFGCAYYPWQAMSIVPVLKYIVLINPLVYVSEGLRGTLTPSLPHMPVLASLGALVVIITTFWMMGIRTFRKRALG